MFIILKTCFYSNTFLKNRINLFPYVQACIELQLHIILCTEWFINSCLFLNAWFYIVDLFTEVIVVAFDNRDYVILVNIYLDHEELNGNL